METPASTRLDRLFAKTARPPLPDPHQRHIADIEMEPKPKKVDHSSLTPNLAPPSREVDREQLLVSRDLDQLTSSNEDEFVASFMVTPAMASTPTTQERQSRSGSAPAVASHQSLKHSCQERDSPLQSVPRDKEELANADEFGKAVTGHFCLFTLLAKFPYKYMVDTNDRVSRHFFADNKFYNRTWDLWYIYPPPALGTAAILLVPLHQARDLIQEIGTAFKAKVSVPPFPFTVTFFDDNTPQPRFLGTSTCRDHVNTMQISIPSAPEGYGEPPANASPATLRCWATWLHKIEEINEAKKGTKAKNKKRTTERRIQYTRDWVNQLNRAQRYLGLRPRTTSVVDPDSATSWAEQQDLQITQAKKSGQLLEPLDTSKPAPHPFDKSVVIICFDVEAWEKPPRPITEIGVSTLDTLDLVDLAPGPNGENWMKHIRSRHFRVAEVAHLRNKDYCYGDPERFLFGKSEVVGRSDAARAVDDCFEYPFSAQFKHDGAETPVVTEENSDTASLVTVHVGEDIGAESNPTTPRAEVQPAPEVDISSLQKGPRQRNILVLGHGTDNDVEYLQKLGSEIFTQKFVNTSYPMPPTLADGTGRAHVLASLVEQPFDLQILFQVLKRASQPDNLGSILTEIGKTGWGLHNGGNDARYTMEGFIGVCVKARQQWDQRQELKRQGITADTPEWHQETANRLEAAVESAKEEVLRSQQIFDEAIERADREEGTEVVSTSGHQNEHAGNGPPGADEPREHQIPLHDLPVRPKEPARRNSDDWEL